MLLIFGEVTEWMPLRLFWDAKDQLLLLKRANLPLQNQGDAGDSAVDSSAMWSLPVEKFSSF